MKFGYTEIKITLGRDDKRMERSVGDKRDIEVTKAVRAAIGPNTMLMADPKYGYWGRFDQGGFLDNAELARSAAVSSASVIPRIGFRRSESSWVCS